MRAILAETPDQAQLVLNMAMAERGPMGYDTETQGEDLKKLSPVLNHTVVCFSLAGKGEDGRTPWKACVDGEYFGMFKGWLEDPKRLKIDANDKFEQHICWNHHINLAGNLVDVVTASATLDPHIQRGHGVEAAAQRNIGRTKRKFSQVVSDHDTMRAWIMDRENFALYSMDDAEVELETGLRLIQRLEKSHWVADKSMWDYYKRYQQPFGYVLAEMERYGVAVDREYMEAALDRARKLTKGAAFDVAKVLGWTHGKIESFLDSPAQLVRELFDRRRLPVVMHTMGGQCPSCGRKVTKRDRPMVCPDHPDALLIKTPSTSDVALDRIKDRDPLVGAIMRYRKFAKKIEELEIIIGAIHPVTGRIHTSFNQAIARTGRLTSSNPNLQNQSTLDKEKEVAKKYNYEPFDIRHGFVASPGMIFVDHDESQLEYRVLAHFSGEPVLVNGFFNNEDFHSITAKAIFGDGFTKEQRKVSKNGNFCAGYGGGAKKLAFTLRISEAQAEEFLAQRERALPSTYRWQREQVAKARKTGYVSNILGWRRPVPDITHEDGFYRSKAERICINTPIQSSAAEILKCAMLRLLGPTDEWKSEISEKYRATGARLLLQVHDELVAEVPYDTARLAADITTYVMEHPLRQELRVPLKAEFGLGTTWSEAK